MRLDTSGDYEIRVQGVVAATWSDYLGGAVIGSEGKPEAPVTVLHGTFQDQAALFGILNTLYDLGFPLVSVDCSDSDAPPASAAVTVRA